MTRAELALRVSDATRWSSRSRSRTLPVMLTSNRRGCLSISFVAAVLFAATTGAAQSGDPAPPAQEGAAAARDEGSGARGHGEDHAADVGVDEPRTVRVAASDQDLADRALDAVMMPLRAQRIRDAGVDAAVLHDLIVEMAENGEDADGITAALEAVLDSAERVEDTPAVSAFVRARLDEGVRGRALAEALEAAFGAAGGPATQPTRAADGSGEPASAGGAGVDDTDHGSGSSASPSSAAPTPPVPAADGSEPTTP